jgi:SAM-dependent methyltransferase
MIRCGGWFGNARRWALPGLAAPAGNGKPAAVSSQALLQLYQRLAYPAMSHPSADPARAAVAAVLAGLELPDLRRARILEIGCGTGHHLLPLALRWPEARLTGVDFSPPAIRAARSLAAASGLAGHVRWAELPFEQFAEEESGGQPYDVILAHGFFSWVPAPVRRLLLEFCARRLTTNGFAVISFNVEAGWNQRRAVIERVRAIQIMGKHTTPLQALRVWREVCEDPVERAIVDDMIAKGPAILACDDFAPVNDPYPLDRFVAAAGACGLRWLGESDPASNRPPCWTAEDERAVRQDAGGETAAVDFHQKIDEHGARSFRSALLCRADAAVRGRVRVGEIMALHFSIVPAEEQLPDDADFRAMHRVLAGVFPATLSGEELAARLEGMPPASLARRLGEALAHGWLRARSEPLRLPADPPQRPQLDRLRMACARKRLPLVDAWHVPCAFSGKDYASLQRIDGSRSLADLRQLAAEKTPRQDFPRWIRHLHERGMLDALP